MRHKDISLRKKVLIILLVLVTSIFFYLKIIPSGHISYTRSYPRGLSSGKGFIYSFSPQDRLKTKTSNVIIGDPVYFSVFTPRSFDTVKLQIKYKDKLSTSTPVIEIGVLVDNLIWRYQLQAVDNKNLDSLLKNWNVYHQEGLIFLQRDKEYTNLSDFLKDVQERNIKNCPNIYTCLAIYKYPLDLDVKFKNIKDKNTIISIPLRGTHQFYTYVASNHLNLNISFVDLNQDKKADPITVNVYKGSKLIKQTYLKDDNLHPTDAKTELKKIAISINNLETGIYRVEIKISDDMVIKNIYSSSDYLSFLHKVWPVSMPGPIKIYTDANYIQVKALTPSSKQSIIFANKEYKINKIYKQYLFSSREEGLQQIKLDKSDIIIENNGVFSFTKNSLFNPVLKSVDNNFSLNPNIKYIIAKYKSPQKSINNEILATTELDLKPAYREDGKYSFIISVPGLRTDDNINDYIEVESIRLEFKGRTLGEKIKSLF